MAYFSPNPRFKSIGTGSNVGNVMEEVRQFNFLYEVGQSGSVNGVSCDNVDFNVYWRKYVASQVIKSASRPVELDFFESLAGGAKNLTQIEAKEKTFKQNGDFDHNIYAKTAVTGAGANLKTKFTLHPSNHYLNGTKSYPVVGYEIYCYQDRQWLRVTDVDRTVPYAHRIEVEPKVDGYTVNVRSNSKMLVSPATSVGGYTCANDYIGEFTTPGYLYKMTLVRKYQQWKLAVDFAKAVYTDILQFGVAFDNEGNQIDCWDVFKRIKARENLRYALNLEMFTGQKTTNTDIFINSMGGDSSYPGCDGYLPQVRNGGGVVWNFDAQYGIDLYADFYPLLQRQDATKRVTEYTMVRGLQFEQGFDRNITNVLRVEQGANSFQTFKAVDSGNDMQNITRQGIDTIKLGNLIIHRKFWSALTDSRSIGNYDFPGMAIMMPTAGLTYVDGGAAPAMEFFTLQGKCGFTGGYDETYYDARKEKVMCEEVGGAMWDNRGWVINGIQDHIILQPNLCN